MQQYACHAKHFSSKFEDMMLQNANPLWKSAPPNMSDSCVSCTVPATRHAYLIIFADSHACLLFETAANTDVSLL